MLKLSILCLSRKLLRPKTIRQHIDSGWLAAALLPLIAITPIFNGQMVANTADGLFHVHRIFAMTTLMQHGDLYPRWIPWFHLGYGYPVFNFYAPAATWLGGLPGIMGISAPLAFTLVVALAWIIGSLGMYALGRDYLPPLAALLAALLWCYAPTRLQGVWNVGSVSQLLATALAPWLFFTLMRAIRFPGGRRCAALALVWGVVILSHQPTTILLGLMIVPVVAVSLWYDAKMNTIYRVPTKRLLWVIAGLALGVGLAGIFVLPMLAELPYINVAQPAHDIPATLAANFLRVDQLFIQPLPPDLSDLNRNLPETVGLLTGILALAGLQALVRRRRYGVALGSAVGAVLILFLTVDVSMPVWMSTSLLSQLRFPGRALHIGTIFFALLGGASLLILPRRWQSIGMLVLSGLVIISALPTIYPSREWIDFSQLSAANEIRYELATYSFGGTSYDEFKPNYGTSVPYDAPDVDSYVNDPLRIRVIDPKLDTVTITPIDMNSVQVNAGEAFELRFRQFYYPGWRATVDGAAVAVFSSEQHGLVSLNVPTGEHVVTVWREATAAQAIAPFMSLVSIIVIGILWFRNRQPVGAVREPPLPRRTGLALTLVLTGFALINTLYIQPRTDWFRLRSPLESSAYMQTAVHQTFGDAYELLGYTLHQTQVAPDGWLEITLYWRALRPLDGIYRPTTQLVNEGVSEAWAVSEKFFIGTFQAVHSPEYFVSDTHKLRVFADAPTATGRILLWLTDPNGERLKLPDESDRLLLDVPVQVKN